MPVEALVLLALILLNGVFAMSEIALVTARKSRLQVLVDCGDRGAAAALELSADPTRFLSTVQVGITSIGVLSGIVREAAFAEPLRGALMRLGLDEKVASVAATGFVVVVVTYFAIMLGELVPKRLGQLSAEAVARRMAHVPEEERGRYHTLSGMLMLLLGRLPRTSDFVDWNGWRFEIVDLDGRRIDKVHVGRIPEMLRAT